MTGKGVIAKKKRGHDPGPVRERVMSPLSLEERLAQLLGIGLPAGGAYRLADQETEGVLLAGAFPR